MNFLCFFPIAPKNDYYIVVDGTDVLDEGEWLFTESTDGPFIPNNIEVDTDRNCLVIVSANTSYDTNCQSELDRAMFCESEGNYSQSVPL